MRASLWYDLPPVFEKLSAGGEGGKVESERSFTSCSLSKEGGCKT